MQVLMSFLSFLLFRVLYAETCNCSGLLPTFCADASSCCKQLEQAHAELQGKQCASEGADPFTRVVLPGGAGRGKSAVLMILPRPESNTRNWIIWFGMLTQQQTTCW